MITMNPFLERKRIIGLENYNEDYDDSQDLSTIIRESKPDLTKQIEAMLAAMKTPSRHMLVEEISDIFMLVADQVKNLEYIAEARRRKRWQQLTGDFIEFCSLENDFQKQLRFCQKTLSLYIKCFGFEPATNFEYKLHGKDLYNRIEKFTIITKGKHRSEKQKELNFYLGQIMIRFAGICESENVKHNLPVPTDGYITPPELPPPSTAVEGQKPNKIERFIRTNISTKKTKKEKALKDENEENSDFITVGQNLDKDNIKTATAFIEVYCKMNGLQLQYDDLGVVKTTWNSEHIYTCKILKYAGEGRGKRRAVAKQRAAANLMKAIAGRQRRGKLVEELKPLSIEQLELAIMLMSEYLPFDEELEHVARDEYQRLPIYTSLINTPGNYIRCKALGLNAVGYGKTKDIARRMSAKLILDKYQDMKDQKKKEQKLKMCSKLDNVSNKQKCIPV